MSTDIAPTDVALEVRLTDQHGGTRPVTRGIVLHATRGATSQAEGESLEDMLDREYEAAVRYMQRDNDVSAHFCVGPKRIARMVHDDAVAWHAREHNQTHLGIEIAQPRSLPPYTDTEMDYTARICALWCEKYGIPPIHVTDSDLAGIIAHSETDQGRRDGKSDPGGKWDWGVFIPLLQSYLVKVYKAGTLARNGVPIGAAFAKYLNEKVALDPDYGEPRIMCEVNPTEDTMLYLTTPRVLWHNHFEDKVRQVR